MKYILILLLVFLTLEAQDKKQKITIGAGPFIQTQPYKNVDNIVLPSPVIFFDNGIAYVRWSRAGIYFFGDKQEDYAWGFSLTVQPRVYGYKSSDINGMDERKNTWEGGLAFSAKTDSSYLEVMLLTDMLDRYESWILKTEIGYDFEFSNFSLYPSLIFIYQSSDFLNYYYGVKKSEELGSRKEYIPNDGLQIGAQTYIKYPFTENFSALINLRVDRISKEATKSPIVDEDYIYSGLLSLIYTFEY
ncbi:MltA-interacting protein MipA [Sulfurimonas gotlandica GD1]|uniref:MltA-interacting protein MipA n=1 Tax=Sulfurimonas gotlandica (strain DSM 19862 / JCM 16533 / GD1) TaxID=929558 RepID=B6BKD0_SULGG|nr:MipA/OmpV family protein [Sulfurimonas gotlandica]EDZ62246.1 MltA-interacting protein MipA [Sulfurimonas gotlandica GD1]EHP28985.1 MltA-interacting protein MipA [Sulfurimonas gotlandica GD1]